MQYSRKYDCVYHLEYMCFIPLILHLEVFNKDASTFQLLSYNVTYLLSNKSELITG